MYRPKNHQAAPFCLRSEKSLARRPHGFHLRGIASSSVKGSASIPILLCALMWAAPAIAQEKVEKIKDDANETVWSIKQPEVKTARRDYRIVTFKKYDEVVVTGGGCVQTGGKGRTWKRYIDPSGTNSDRLYHGRIWIPGATDGLTRISSLEKMMPLVVNKFPDHPAGAEEPSAYFLRLGYEDDNYKDNGYQKHDNGTDNQCVLKEDPGTDGNAWLNQGSCSNGWDLTRSKWLHYLGLHENRMKFFLPAKMGPSTIVTAKLNTAKFKTQSLSDGVLLTIQLSEPEKKELFWGELRIKK